MTKKAACNFITAIINYEWNVYIYEIFAGLQVIHEGGCSLYEVRKILGRDLRTKACSVPRRTFEVNPICTRQNVTYANPFKALCDAPRAVRERVGGVCGCPFQRSCERAREIHLSIKAAPHDERTRYIVCGSDFRTYRSKYHLECSRRFNRSKAFRMACNERSTLVLVSIEMQCFYFILCHFKLADLYMTHYGRCKKLEEPCPQSLKFLKTAAPVCGSDGRSYTTYEALICAQFRVSKGM